MNDISIKKYFLYSLGLHCLIIMIGSILTHSATIRHTFIVLGVHSKKPSKTLFKQFGNQASTQKLDARVKSLPVKQPLLPARGAVKKAPTPKKMQPTKKALPVKKAPTKPEVKQVARVSLEKGINKPQEKKQATNLAQKKQPEKKVVTPKKELQVKKEITQKNQEIKPEKIMEKKHEPAPELKETFAKQNDQDDILAQQISDQVPDQNEESVTVAFTDRDMVLYQRVVRQEIGQRWQPPLGVPKGTECTVRFEVADDGVVKNAELVRRSEVLIFDLSTIRCARNCTFAQCLWGKTFQVDFRQ